MSSLHCRQLLPTEEEAGTGVVGSVSGREPRGSGAGAEIVAVPETVRGEFHRHRATGHVQSEV